MKVVNFTHSGYLNISRNKIEAFCLFLGLSIWVYFLFLGSDISSAFETTTENIILLDCETNLLFNGNPLMCVSQKTQMLWNERDFLVVFGIPSLDISIRRWRRRLQRVTCWQFPEVAARHNNFTGALLPLYLLGKHPINNFVLSEEAVREAKESQDILVHPINEGSITTTKIVTGKGKWGLEAEIGSSRKTFFWFYFALCHFPRVPFIGKGDDDMFLRVPQYLMDVRCLPRSRVYWGRYNVENEKYANGKEENVEYMCGYCFTLSFDVARQLVRYKELQKLIMTPYNKSIEDDFLFLSMKHEDVMVGRALKLTGYPFIYFAEYHNRFVLDLRPAFYKLGVVVHVPKEHEYFYFMSHFLSNPTTSKRTALINKTHRFVVMSPRWT